jgi:hypothetical protein
VRILQKAGFEALFTKRFSVAQDTWQETNTGINQHHGGQLATRKDEIAKADFFQSMRIDYPLVNALVPAAQKHHSGPAARERTRD